MSTATITWSLQPGVNIVSAPFTPYTSIKAFVRHTDIIEVRRVVDGEWQHHEAGAATFDFNYFEPQYGHIITTTTAASFDLQGPVSQTTVITLNGDSEKNQGLNLIGVPTSSTFTTVEDFFVERATLEFFAVRAAYRFSTTEQRYLSYIPSRPSIFNFNHVARGLGYFVMMNRNVEMEVVY